jgi:hypothetical protein
LQSIKQTSTPQDELYVKIDEILRARLWEKPGGLSGQLRITKSRPIYPTSDAGTIAFTIMPGFLKATWDEERQLPVPLILSEKLDWVFVYMKKCNSETLTNTLRDVAMCHFITTLSLGDDVFVLLNCPGLPLLCICSDYVSCDLSANEMYQDFFHDCLIEISDDPTETAELCRRMATLRQSSVRTTPKDLEPLHIYEVVNNKPKGTKTGFATTSMIAMGMTLTTHSQVATYLERQGIVTSSEPSGDSVMRPETEAGLYDFGHHIVHAIQVINRQWGFTVDFETYEGNMVMPAQAGTFLGGTFDFVDLVWVPLKFFKATYMPYGLFGKTRLEQTVGWARVLLKDEASILPIREVLQTAVDIHSHVATDAWDKWVRHLELKRDWHLEHFESPTYTISWEAWERQLNVLMRKHQYESDVADVATCLAQLKDLVNFSIETWSMDHGAPLFVARFGCLPEPDHG